ncbi:hypothetical protein SAMN06296386_102156 [Lachnospiraceae bacterium]|nr:hypothetical protein SAMN06296386_102156 [Lachnospiraceae bacterium]
MIKLFDRLPVWARLIWLSLELAIVLFAIFMGTKTTILYQGF